MMGDVAATVAAIFQRAEHIKSPGGYLRALVERKRRGEFSLDPVLQALMRAQPQALLGYPAAATPQTGDPDARRAPIRGK